jgi:hypothetical protein
MLQKAPEVTVSSTLQPAHVPAVVEFMKIMGLGYTGKLRADAEGEGGGDGDDGGEGGSDGGSSERGEEDGGSGRGEVGEVGGEEAEEGSDGEWKFGLFE